MQTDFVGTIFSNMFKGIWLLFWSLWPIWLILCVVLAVRLFLDLEIDNWVIRRKFKKGEKWRSGRDLLQWLRGMEPKEFENYIAHLFSKLGYKTQSVGQSHDGGIDVIIEKDGVTSYIQCKKFITRQVPVGAVRDFYGAMADRGAHGKGYFITTNKFTLEAEKFAEDKPMELVDGFKLTKYIELAKMGAEAPLSEPKKCPLCGSEMVKRRGKFGEFYGCTRYPACKGTLKID